MNNLRPNFRSKLEKTIWDKLKKTRGRRKSPKVTFETAKLPYILVRSYIPDIIFERPNGKTTFIEVKGYLRPEDRSKMIAVKRFDPSIDLRIVFASDNKMNKHSGNRYSDWAKKNNIPYSIGEIPPEWLDK